MPNATLPLQQVRALVESIVQRDTIVQCTEIESLQYLSSIIICADQNNGIVNCPASLLQDECKAESIFLPMPK